MAEMDAQTAEHKERRVSAKRARQQALLPATVRMRPCTTVVRPMCVRVCVNMQGGDKYVMYCHAIAGGLSHVHFTMRMRGGRGGTMRR
eukprot:3215498-Pleurochrysis_carterae.AAC.1